MRGDDLQFRRLADNGEVGLETAVGQRARTGLRVFLINQTGENNFRLLRTVFAASQFHHRRQHRRHGTFRVARAAPVQPTIFALRNESRSVRADGVQMRREQNGLPDFSGGPEPGENVGTNQLISVGRASSRAEIRFCRRLAGSLAPPREFDFLKFHFQSGARGGGGEKIRDALFAGVRMARRQEGGIHAGQRDEFGEQFFRARHGGRLPQTARVRKGLGAMPNLNHRRSAGFSPLQLGSARPR